VTILLRGAKAYLGGLKPGLLRVCNDQGSRFISTPGRLAFDSPTVLVNALIGSYRVTSDNATNQDFNQSLINAASSTGQRNTI